jgi:hypothetical protein
VLRVPLPAIRFNPEGLAAESGQRHHGEFAGRGDGAAASPAAMAALTPGEHRAADESVGEHGHSHGGRGAQRARVWVMRAGKLVAVPVRAGLDDGTLIEVAADELKEGDVVVVNAVRPNQPKPEGGERPPGTNVNQRPGLGGNNRL